MLLLFYSLGIVDLNASFCGAFRGLVTINSQGAEFGAYSSL